MKDYAPKAWLAGKPAPMENKLGRAIGYLIKRGIWRGRADCKHVYRDSEGRRRTPVERPDGLPF